MIGKQRGREYRSIDIIRPKTRDEEEEEYKMMDRGKGNEIMSEVRADDEVGGRLEADVGAEIADREGDSATVVDIARVPQESDAGVRLVLDG